MKTSTNSVPLNFVTVPPAKEAAPPQPACEEAIKPIAVVTAEEASALYLTPPQCAAIVKLTSGATKSAAAAAAGVTRVTLYNWLNHDANFQAAYNAWHKDVMTTAQSQLLSASQDAIACVLTAIRRGDSKLAWKLLEAQGLTKLGKPGSTDVGFLQRLAELDLKRAEVKELQEISKINSDEIIAFTLP